MNYQETAQKMREAIAIPASSPEIAVDTTYEIMMIFQSTRKEIVPEFIKKGMDIKADNFTINQAYVCGHMIQLICEGVGDDRRFDFLIHADVGDREVYDGYVYDLPLKNARLDVYCDEFEEASKAHLKSYLAKAGIGFTEN